MNAAGSGCTERVDAGVSHFGAAIIRRLNELGVIVDTGHSGKQTTLDCCHLSERPVVASHASAGGLYEIDRAKSDEELDAIAATGGVIGVVAVPFFLAPGPAPVTIDAMLDHIDYIARRVGWEHVAIGTDWPLQSPKTVLERSLTPMVSGMGFRPEHNISPCTNTVGFDDYGDFPNITRGLVARGYADEQVRGIIGSNFLRVFEAVCG
jgi:membrane dipeptidase